MSWSSNKSFDGEHIGRRRWDLIPKTAVSRDGDGTSESRRGNHFDCEENRQDDREELSVKSCKAYGKFCKFRVFTKKKIKEISRRGRRVYIP